MLRPIDGCADGWCRRSREGHTLSIHEIPDFPVFDMFSSKAAPYHGFGGVVQDSNGLESQLHAEAAQVRRDVQKTCRAKLETSASIPKELDGIIEKMWETGWDPRVGNLNLFTRTFGLLLFETTLELLGGKPIFARRARTMSTFTTRSSGRASRRFRFIRRSSASPRATGNRWLTSCGASGSSWKRRVC